MPFTPELTKSQRRRLRRAKMVDVFHIVLLFVVAALLLLCAVMDRVFIGQVIVGVFGIVGLITKIGSEKTFKFAVITFIAVPTTAFISPYSDTPENMAVFSFLLLIVGMAFGFLESLANRPSRKNRN